MPNTRKGSEESMGRAILRRLRADLRRTRANSHHYCGWPQTPENCPDEMCEALTEHMAELDTYLARKAIEAAK